MSRHLGDGMRDLAEAGAAQREGLTASPAVAHAVRRRRLLRGTLWGAGAALCLGTVGAAAASSLVEVMAAEHAAEPAPTLSVTDTVVDHATVSFEDSTGPAWRMPVDLSGPVECGRPLPEPTTTVGEFAAAFDLPQSGTVANSGSAETPRATIEVTYGGSEDLPTVSEPVTALFARDGVVVGHSMGSQELGLSTWHEGGSSRHTWDSSSWVVACPDGDEPGTISEEMLAPGEYEVVWTMQVHASQGANAQMALLEEGYTVPHSSMADIYREGSYDCQDVATYDGEIPLTCEPGALFGTEIDLEAGTVTFPYRASAYVRDVDATFVSQSRTLTLDIAPGMDWWTQLEEEHPFYQPGTPLECRDEVRWGGDGVVLGWEMAADQLSDGARSTATAWTWTADWSERTLHLPESTRIWLTTTKEVMHDVGDGGQVGTSVDVVTGWADVTMPASVEMVRYDGPADLEITIDEVAWCDGRPPAAEFPLQGLIIDPHQETDGSGATRDVLGPIVVWHGSGW